MTTHFRSDFRLKVLSEHPVQVQVKGGIVLLMSMLPKLVVPMAWSFGKDSVSFPFHVAELPGGSLLNS